MPRKPKNKTGDQENMNPRSSEDSSMNKTRRSASMGEDVEETTYDKDKKEEDDVEEVDVTDDEDEDEDGSSTRKS